MKLKHFLPIICCIIFSNTNTHAQQNNTLRGKILYLNSGKQPATGVKIAGTVKVKDVENANVQYTTSNGSFELVFPAERDGHQVNLEIGAEDQLGQAIEVVNDKEVDICRIPAIATDEFEIIVSPLGARDIVAKRYYNIIKTSADLALEEKKKELEILLVASERNFGRINALSETINRLKKQTDSLVIYRTAWRIASINKDKAGERVLQYIDALDSGKTIQEALEYLSLELAGKQAGKAIETFNEAIVELELLADGSLFDFDYEKAIAYYDTILLKLQEVDKNPLTIAGCLDKSSTAALKAGKDSTALAYSFRSRNIYVEFLNPDHPDLTTCHQNIAQAYCKLGKYDLALINLQKAVELGFDDLEWLKTEDSLDGLRNKPTFINLLERLEK